MKILCEVQLDNFWVEAVHQTRLISPDQSKRERDLTRDLYSFGLVDFAFLTSSLTTLSQCRECRDVIVVEDVKRGVVFLRVGEEHVHNKVTIIGMLLSFDVNKLLEVLVVDDKVPEITICGIRDTGSFLFDFFQDLVTVCLY